MTDDRRQRIEQLYLDALDVPAVERPEFLDRSCAGDFALRGEVEALLALESGAVAFLEESAIESAARTLADILPALRPPEIPGYKIVRHLGEGGMGLVYLAKQEAPLRRLVALKVIRPGMDSRQVVARFNAERQALAQMDHPNIAAVHDAGTTGDGRPYFVMEFVDGPPITEYCDRKGLTTTQRLELFTQVCAGVQHAHQKGVIHRDLKPSNVLVTEQDARPMPKVIDFGTAKAIDRSVEGAVTLTAHGMVLGTIEYMSPEQASFSRDIDTTTDVYSLGVMLYELLVGVLPFERRRPGPEGYDELRRLIRESDPPRPSTRLSAIAENRAGIASVRQTDPDRLRRSVQGDLDWITLKALEKDRTRRYPTVAALAADIQRFLLDQTVDARPPSAAYRIRKFTRRHRGAVAAALSLFVVLAAGLAASRWQYLRAEDARIEANRQRTQAESERAGADSARAAAELSAAEANIQKDHAERQRLMATKETQRAFAALDLADYRNYVITIAAADAEILASRFSDARERLLTVPVATRGWEWHHLFLRADKILRTLAGVPCSSAPRPGSPVHTIDTLVKDPDGRRVYFKDCQHVNSWNTETFERSVAASNSNALVAAAPSSRRVEFSAASDGATPQPEKKWNVHVVDSIGVHLIGSVDRQPACADVSRDGRILALGLRPLYRSRPISELDPDGPVSEIETDVFEVWDVPNSRRISQVKLPKPSGFDTRINGGLNCVVRLSPDTTLLATSGAVVRVFVVATGVPVHVDSGQAGVYPQAIAFSPTARQLAIGRRNGLIDVLDYLNSNWTIKSLDGADILQPRPLNERDRFADVNSRRHEEVRAIAFASDGRAIVSSQANRVIVWDLPSARVRKVLDTHQSLVTGLVVHEQLVYSAHADATVRVQELEALSGVTRIAGSTPSSGVHAMSVDGRTVALGSSVGALTVWHPDDRSEVLVRRAPGTRTGTGFSTGVVVPLADKRTILTDLSKLGTLMRWDSETRQGVSLPTMDRTEPGCASAGLARADVSRNDRYLAMWLGNCVVVRDLATARTLAILRVDRPGYSLGGRYIRFLSDESLLVAASHTQTQQRQLGAVSVMQWNWTTNRLSVDRFFPGPPGPRFAVAASDDGHRIALSVATGFATIWDGGLTRQIGRIPVPVDYHVMALSADGARLAVATSGQTSILVWDTEKSQLLLTLTDDDTPQFLAFTPAGELIAANASGGLTIWETQRSKCAQCPKAPAKTTPR